MFNHASVVKLLGYLRQFCNMTIARTYSRKALEFHKYTYHSTGLDLINFQHCIIHVRPSDVTGRKRVSVSHINARKPVTCISSILYVGYMYSYERE